MVLQFASCLTWLVRWVTETETQMNAVQRILTFCTVQREAEAHSKGTMKYCINISKVQTLK